MVELQSAKSLAIFLAKTDIFHLLFRDGTTTIQMSVKLLKVHRQDQNNEDEMQDRLCKIDIESNRYARIVLIFHSIEYLVLYPRCSKT